MPEISFIATVGTSPRNEETILGRSAKMSSVLFCAS